MIDPRLLKTFQLGLFLVLSVAMVPPKAAFSLERDWEPPVIGSALIRSYLQSQTPYGPGHRGVDYAAKIGQGVFAPASGVVHFSGRVVDRAVISIEHPGNLISAFEPVCSNLREGDKVAKGDLIGEVCQPLDDYQPHCNEMLCLHFSARAQGEYLSPLWLTGELRPARLLPWVEP
ncbi:MAG: M23 family metallopeptidase [Actinomycetota bacterium]